MASLQLLFYTRMHVAQKRNNQFQYQINIVAELHRNRFWAERIRGGWPEGYEFNNALRNDGAAIVVHFSTTICTELNICYFILVSMYKFPCHFTRDVLVSSTNQHQLIHDSDY